MAGFETSTEDLVNGNQETYSVSLRRAQEIDQRYQTLESVLIQVDTPAPK